MGQELYSTVDEYRAWVAKHLGATESADATLLRQVMAAMNWHPDEWEHGFLKSITIAIANKRPLSPKQLAVLEGRIVQARENPQPVDGTTPRKRRRVPKGETVGQAVQALPLLARADDVRLIVPKAVFKTLRDEFQTVVVGVKTRRIEGKKAGPDKYEVWTEDQ